MGGGENYCDYSDGSWCEISVNDDDSVDSFVRVDSGDFENSVMNMTELFSTSSNVIKQVDDELRVTDDDLAGKISDIEVIVVDTLKKDEQLDEKVKSKEQVINDKPESVKEDKLEAKVPTGFSTFAYGSIPDVLVGEKAPLEAKDLAKIPTFGDKYISYGSIPDVLVGEKAPLEAKDLAKIPTFGDKYISYGSIPDVLVGQKTSFIAKETKVPTGFSTFDQDGYPAYGVPDVLVGEKTQCGAKEAKVPTGFSIFDQLDENIPYGSIPDILVGEKVQCEAEEAKVHTGFPMSLEDEQLGELIKNAQVQLDKKIRSRDVFRAQIALQEWRVKGHIDTLNAAYKKIMAARELVESKEHEIDYVENVIKRLKNIDVVEDIDIMISKLEKRVQYEIMSLLDERKLIREINQLRRIRAMGSRYEIQEALDRKEHIDELVEDLKDELGVLQDDVSKAEEAAQAIEKTYEKEAEIEEEMWAQYKVIQDSREEALVYLEGLKKRLDDKKIDFHTYDEGIRAHGEEGTKKEEIDVILKDLRDLEEVCNDHGFMGATRYFYSPSGHQVISQLNPYTQPMINNPMERLKHDAEKAQMQAEQRAQKEAEQKEEVRLATERQKHDAEIAQMQAEQRAQKEAEQKAKAKLKRLKRKERKRAKSCINDIDTTINMVLLAALYIGLMLMVFLLLIL